MRRPRRAADGQARGGQPLGAGVFEPPEISRPRDTKQHNERPQTGGRTCDKVELLLRFLILSV